MITRNVVYVVSCERCPAGLWPFFDSRSDAAQAARDEGWCQITGKTAYRGDWLCPECAMAWEREEAS